MGNTPVSLRIVSLQVGAVADLTGADGSVLRTAICKQPVNGPVHLGTLGLAGDEQGNRKYHGGADKAVCCFPFEHYPAVERIIGGQLAAAAFGENFTTEGLTESGVCIGDRFEVGSALVEVSQPRQPCPTLTHRWHARDLPKQMVKMGLSGWYLRVVQSGEVSAGMPLLLIERPNPDWTVARLNGVRHGQGATRADLQAARDLPALSATWREDLDKRLSVSDA